MDLRDLRDKGKPISELNARDRIIIVIVGYVIFCGISLLSRRIYPLFGLVVLIGIAVPLIWARLGGNWQAIGLSLDRWTAALAWAVPAGAFSSVVGLLLLERIAIPRDLGRQLLIGVPFWILIISPFQEFFFRGWIQSELAEALGVVWGLLLASVGFTLWHYLSPIVDLAPMPLVSGVAVASTFIVGLVYGYTFQRTGNLISPWIGHAISGIVFVSVGAMDFVQALNRMW